VNLLTKIMKKIFLFASVAILGLASVGCTSDDSNSSQFDKDIQGVWIESRTLYLDDNNKVIDEDKAYDEGCGLNELEFKGKTIISRSFYLDEMGCEADEFQSTFYIKGDMLYARETNESTKIVELTATKLVIVGEILTDEDVPVIGAFGETVDPYENIKTVHMEFVRK